MTMRDDFGYGLPPGVTQRMCDGEPQEPSYGPILDRDINAMFYADYGADVGSEIESVGYMLAHGTPVSRKRLEEFFEEFYKLREGYKDDIRDMRKEVYS